MILFHFCKKFQDTLIDQEVKEDLHRRLQEHIKRDNLKGIASIDCFGKDIYVLKVANPRSRIIIEKQSISIEGEEVDVYFVRDVVLNRNFDRIYGRLIFPKLKNGEWLRQNPLEQQEIDDFTKTYKIAQATGDSILEFPPQNLVDWVESFKLELNNEIFETEKWVEYALNSSETEGMLDKHVYTFRLVIEEILNNNIDTELIKEENNVQILKYENHNIGVLYSKLNIDNRTIIILYDGAYTPTQNTYWKNSIQLLKTEDIEFQNNIESISRQAFRSYPRWTITDDELWFNIQQSAEISNLSLTREQINFFKNFKFPYYINGQAGSGKSTMLYYLFANIYYYKCLDLMHGELIFLTENEKLLSETQKYVFDLLTNNPEFDGLTSEQKNNSKKYFNSFKNFLLELLGEDDKVYFKPEKYLNFSIFKNLYENSNLPKHIIKKYSSEESWFTIITYIYGHDLNMTVTSKNYEDLISRDSQKIPLEKFKGIEEHVLPFFNNLITEEEYWDKLKIIRYINQNINMDIKTKYSALICDEAQDFCRVELHFILRLSEYLQYNLSQTLQVAVVFAGDSNQTVNPTGFRQDEMTSMLYNELKGIAKFNYQAKKNIYNPSLNYRSAHPVVSLANFVQYYRIKNLSIKQAKPQEAKRPSSNIDKDFNLFLSYDEIKNDIELQDDLVVKLKYKIFIVPVDSEDKSVYASNSSILSLIDEIELKTSVEAKGAEYKQVVLYGFGEYFIEHFGTLNQDLNMDETFKISYFFNKLYVGLTRAQTELIIIDSEESRELFWKKLVDNAHVTNTAWNTLEEIKDKVIEYDPGSISSILVSTRDDALENAEKDKKQGEYHGNSARLKVASNQFFKLGLKEKANECLALAEELKYNYKAAAVYYLKSNYIESAANALFKGRHFQQLKEIGNTLKTPEQDIRIILTRVIDSELLIEKEIQTLYKYSEVLDILIKDLDWRDTLLLQFVNVLQKIKERKSQKDFIKTLKTIASSKDTILWEAIADIYYDLENYEEAISAWSTIDKYENNEKYCSAQVKLAEEQNSNENIVIWLNECLKFKNKEEQKQYFTRMLKIYNINKEKTFSNEYYLSVYTAFLGSAKGLNILSIAKYCEALYNERLEELNYFYTNKVENYTLNKKFITHVIERWAKTIWKLNKHNISKDWIHLINTKYTEFAQKYQIPYKEFTLLELEHISFLPEIEQWSPSQHLHNISIKNFRQFANIEINNIGQFNLIVGDNNVGKTSILEALLFIPKSDIYFRDLAFSYIARKQIPRILSNGKESYNISSNFIYDFIKKDATPKEIEFTLHENRNQWNYKIRTATKDEISKYFTLTTGVDVNDYVSILSSNVLLETTELPLILNKIQPNDLIQTQFIPFGKGFDKDLVKAYHDHIDKKREERENFLSAMKIFIPNIDRIMADTENGEIYIEELNSTDSSPLHHFGEGAKKLFRTLVQIILQKNGKVLIDEIDAGIHYSHFSDFWKILLQVAKDNNVQIFATTHNIECIQYFKDILQDDDFNDYKTLSRVITLRKLPDNHIKSYTREFEEFEYELENELELRGGKL